MSLPVRLSPPRHHTIRQSAPSVVRAPWRFISLCLLLGSLLFPALSPGAEQAAVPELLSFRNWTTSQGLPHNVVSRVAQDRNGYVWIASLGGLSRFDGREFKTYPVPEGEVSGGRNVRDLAILPDGSILFIHASRGLLQLRHETVSEHPLAKELTGIIPLQLHVEPGGEIWVGSEQQLMRWDGKQIERFPVPNDGSQRSVYFTWVTDRLNRTWVAGPDLCVYYEAGRLVQGPIAAKGNCYVANSHERGMWIFSRKLFSYDGDHLTEIAGAPLPAEGIIRRSLLEDKAGTLWLASWREGLFRFDGTHFQSVANVRTSVRSFFEDAEGNLWLATNGEGIARARKNVFSQLGLQASCVTEDGSGMIWFASGTAGIVKRDPAKSTVQLFPCASSGIEVTTVCADLTGSLWIGTQQGVFNASIQDPSAMRFTGVSGKIHTTFRSQSGDVWVAGQNVLGYFREKAFTAVKSPLPASEEFTCIVEDNKGRILFGASLGGIFELSGNTVVPSKFTPTPVPSRINSIWPDEEGLLWVGTNDGLLCLGGKKPGRLTKMDGLPDDLVIQVLGDGFGNLWLTSPVELYRIAKSELLNVTDGKQQRLQVISHASDQGLSGVSPRVFCSPSALKDSQGKLWLCNYRGVVTVEPANLQRVPTPVPLLLEELRVDERVTPVPAELNVPAGARYLEVRFATPSYIAPERIMVRHQLENFDADWVNTSPDRRVRYTKLEPGRYRLRVTASNADGVWNQRETTLAIQVMPLWWQRVSVRVGAALLLGGLLTWLVRVWSHRKLKARVAALEQDQAIERERARIARDMHDELGGSVTGINLLVQRLVSDHAPAQDSIVDQLDRNIHRLTVELERVVWTVSPKNGTLDRLASYIESFVRNLLSHSEISCRFKGLNDMPKIPLSPEAQHHVLAVIKEAFSNILKHSRASEAQVALHHEKGILTLTITDNGAGFDLATGRSSERNGLQNMHSRTAEIGGSLSFDSRPGSGTKIVMAFPLPGRKA